MEEARKKVKRLRQKGENSEVILTELLHSCGMSFANNGLHYLRESVTFILSFPVADQRKLRLIKDIYPHVASMFNTTPTSVERCIRSSIEVTCLNGNLDFIHDLLGSTLSVKSGKVTSREMIFTLVDLMQQ